jgi:hypothetical protein
MDEKQLNQFYSEWVTIGKHRILLSCRSSFPDSMMKFIAQVAVTTCEHNSEDKKARVVKIFLEDKSSYWHISIGSTNTEDKGLENRLSTIFGEIYNFGNIGAEVHVVEKGNENSDNYEHMEYISRKLFFDEAI